MNQPILITTTSDNRNELETIAAKLIGLRLAACCQISGPVTSIYRWEGAVETSQEWTCSIKTLSSKFDQVEQLVRESHHYETPEIIGQLITNISPTYRDWMVQEIVPA